MIVSFENEGSKPFQGYVVIVLEKVIWMLYEFEHSNIVPIKPSSDDFWYRGILTLWNLTHHFPYFMYLVLFLGK